MAFCTDITREAMARPEERFTSGPFFSQIPQGPPYQQETGVSKTEGPRPADAGTAVHHDGAVLPVERPRLSDFEKKVQE